MLLAELLPDVPGVPADLSVTGLVMDSRVVRPGDAFVAIAGFGAHGLGFVEQARAAGASAILFEPPAPEALPAPADAIAVPNLRARLGEMADRFHGRATADMAVVGVTGTNGKTSTVQLLAQAWTLLGTTCGTIGTLGAGLYGQIVPTGFTTPLVLPLHALLADLHDAGCRRDRDGSELARPRPGARGRRAFRRRRVHQPHPRSPGTTTATCTATARPNRACSPGRDCRRR
jgi:UDP-N-acetylmuramoyl-L-alanyl-D-glutamate--2,6-diaminopimelate ligase